MTDPCDDEDPEALAPGAKFDDYCNLTVAAQARCTKIIASAHALYFHRDKIGPEAAAREAAELLADLDELERAAEFLRVVRAADYVSVKAELTESIPSPPEILESATGPAWRPMAAAPKDSTPVLLKLEDPIPLEDRPDLRPWDGLPFVGCHPGVGKNGYDPGWRFAAPVGHGGFPDDWFVGWRPLPEGAR